MNDKLQFVGLAALHDPPRADSKKLINDLNNLGVIVKMLTGDALSIAREIAKAVDNGGAVIKASELQNIDRVKVF